MLRQETSLLEFKTELEKMTVKEKISALNSGSSTPDESLTTDKELSEEASKEEAKTAMVYLKSEKVLNLGKLKATDYKYNKHIFLPKGETAEKEALHEVRRMSMLEAFKETMGKHSERKDKQKIETNLTKLELAGMKSLQRRVKNEELIVTETDKSGRFCVLKTGQYYKAGEKQTL